MKELIYIIITAIICLTIIQVVALLKDIDGSMFMAIITTISLIVGISLDHFYKKYKLKMRFERDLKKNFRIP